MELTLKVELTIPVEDSNALIAFVKAAGGDIQLAQLVGDGIATKKVRKRTKPNKKVTAELAQQVIEYDNDNSAATAADIASLYDLGVSTVQGILRGEYDHLMSP